MRNCLLAFLIFYSVNVFAQAPGWAWADGMENPITGGGNIGNSISADGDGNNYTTGIFYGTVDFDPGAGVFNLTSVSVQDIFVCKTDSAGNFVWAKGIGGTDADYGRSIAFDPSGNGAVYFTGNFKGTVDFDPGAGVFNLISSGPAFNDIFICKLDTSGNFIWAKAMGGTDDDVAYSLTIDASGSGDIYCSGIFRAVADFDPDAGIFNLISAGDNDIFVSKYNSSGNLVWAKRMGGAANDVSYCIAQGNAGNTDIYTAGSFSGTVDFDPGAGIYNLITAGLDDIFISKLDSAGNFVWAKAMGGPVGDYANSIAIDISGNVYTTGYFAVMADFDPGASSYILGALAGNDIFISKLDSSGNFVWAKGIEAGGHDYGYDIVVDYSGSVYTIGDFGGTADFDPGIGVYNITCVDGYADIFLLALDNAGNFDWVNQVGGTSGEHGTSLVIDASGHLSITGTFSSPALAFGTITLSNTGTGDIFIARLDTVFATGIETISNDQVPVSISPNPFTEELTVSSKEPGEIKIYDIYGRLVFTQMLTNSYPLKISASWQKGIYLIEIITDKGVVVKKVVKN